MLGEKRDFMKTLNIKKLLAVAVAGGLVWIALSASAQDSTSTAVPQLPAGAAQVLQLAQAKVSDTTILAFIQNSGAGYNLSAAQIIYLRQQGISDSVLTAMLNQPKAAVTTAPDVQAVQPAASTAATTPAETSTATVQPTVTYVQTQPVYYADPYYYPYNPYYGYGYWPPVALSFGWGWGGHWGGGGGHWHR
jgi:hypothetical protein